MPHFKRPIKNGGIKITFSIIADFTLYILLSQAKSNEIGIYINYINNMKVEFLFLE